MERSNPCARIGGRSHAVDDQTAAFLLFVSAPAGVSVENAVPRRGGVGEKDPGRQVKRVQCPPSVEGPCQQGEITLGEFPSPPEQAHGDKEISIAGEGFALLAGAAVSHSFASLISGSTRPSASSVASSSSAVSSSGGSRIFISRADLGMARS